MLRQIKNTIVNELKITLTIFNRPWSGLIFMSLLIYVYALFFVILFVSKEHAIYHALRYLMSLFFCVILRNRIRGATPVPRHQMKTVDADWEELRLDILCLSLLPLFIWGYIWLVPRHQDDPVYFLMMIVACGGYQTLITIFFKEESCGDSIQIEFFIVMEMTFLLVCSSIDDGNKFLVKWLLIVLSGCYFTAWAIFFDVFHIKKIIRDVIKTLPLWLQRVTKRAGETCWRALLTVFINKYESDDRDSKSSKYHLRQAGDGDIYTSRREQSSTPLDQETVVPPSSSMRDEDEVTESLQVRNNNNNNDFRRPPSAATENNDEESQISSSNNNTLHVDSEEGTSLTHHKSNNHQNPATLYSNSSDSGIRRRKNLQYDVIPDDALTEGGDDESMDTSFNPQDSWWNRVFWPSIIPRLSRQDHVSSDSMTVVSEDEDFD